MATRYSSHFNQTTGVPLLNRPFNSGMGVIFDAGSIVVPATVALGDFDAVLCCVSGKTIAQLIGDFPDLENGGPTYNGDIVFASPDRNGTLTYTDVYDTSADSVAFTSAVRNRIVWPEVVVPASATGWCYLGLKTLAAPTTGVEGTLKLAMILR